jgi:hypothetical protein
MLKMISSINSLVFVIVLTFLQITVAAPAPVPSVASVPEVHPGPSLPSLESLGWNVSYINSLPDPVFPLPSMKASVNLQWRTNSNVSKGMMRCLYWLTRNAAALPTGP